MSTKNTETTKKSLSSEGTENDPDPANLEQQQQQQRIHTHHNIPQHESTFKPMANVTGTGSGDGDTKSHIPSTSSQAGTSDVSSTMTAGGAGGEKGRGAAAAAATVAADPMGEVPPRQVIAVSASKSPAAFFNLARKFLVSNEMCDLSALEGAIVSAVDAAHLLERSRLASIVR
jgi:hypothetical protein